MIITLKRSDGNPCFRIKESIFLIKIFFIAGSLNASWDIETMNLKTVNDFYEEVEGK